VSGQRREKKEIRLMGMGAKVEKREGMKQKHDKNENMIQGQ